MKTIIIILSVLLAMSLAGILYGTKEMADKRESISIEEAYNANSTEPMPPVVPEPMNSFPVY